MSKRTRNSVGAFIAFLGLVVAGVELGRYWLLDHAIHPIPMIVSVVLFFVGGAIIDVARATQIGNAVVTGAVTIIQALPFGRRATDRLARDGTTVLIPPTGEHQLPPAPKPVPSAPPLPVPPREAATDQTVPDPNAGVGGIL